MLLNELAQWAVLVLLGIMSLGLTRQLGHFIVARKELLLLEGPALGKLVPAEVFGGDSREQFESAMRRSGAARGVIMTLGDYCHGCVNLLDELARLGRPDGVPLLAVVGSGDHHFIQHVADLVDFVVEDRDLERVGRVGLVATPYLLGVDAELKLRHRGISSTVHDFMLEWHAMEGSDSREIENRLDDVTLATH